MILTLISMLLAWAPLAQESKDIDFDIRAKQNLLMGKGATTGGVNSTAAPDGDKAQIGASWVHQLGSAGNPNRWTGQIARVRGVTAASFCAASMR